MSDSLTEITAPYNFVPLSRWVFQPNWVDKVSHDVPFSKGLCGSLDITITAETPILIGDKQVKAINTAPGEVHFFKVNGKEAIPGTSLKGMIRNVLEIASFGKMQFVDDRRLSIRDISSKGFIGKNYAISNVKAGFLRFHPKNSTVDIIPSNFVHISHREMEAYLKSFPALSYIFTNRQTPLVRQKYERWQKLNPQSMDDDDILPQIQFNIDSAATPKMAMDLGRGRYTGTLVFTGQISDKSQNRNGKYRDFVFYDRREEHHALSVSTKVFKDFLYIHGDEDDKGEDKNASSSWRNFWRNHLFENHHEIPVFYHVYEQDEQQVRSIGLAYMYRLAYKHSIGETIDYTSENHRESNGCDLADLLFGKINPEEDKSTENLKSRVSFGLATLVGSATVDTKYSQPTILNGPKPTYFSNYIRQQTQESTTKLASKQYRTYMQKDSEIRGWKRYPVRRWQAVNVQVAKKEFRGKQKANQKVEVKLFPLQKGTTFKSTIRFHNLLPEELGALIWTLKWGNDDKLRHNLGMAKSFGFGQVKLEIVGSDIRPNQAPEPILSFSDYMNQFEQCMEAEYAAEKQRNNTANLPGKWSDSDQIKLLKAMSYPEHPRATQETLKHLQLEDSQRQNQFVVAKQNGWVLPEYGPYSNRDQQLFPRTIRQSPFPKPSQTSQPTEANTDVNTVNQWIETTLNDLKERGRLPATLNPLCSKALAEQWQKITEVAFKNQVRDEISSRWTNMMPDEDVDWWQVPPTTAMKRIKKIYEQG